MDQTVKRFLGLCCFLVGISLIAMGATCNQGTVVTPQNDGEDALVQKAKDAQMRSETAKEHAAWKTLVTKFPMSKLVPTAWYRLGVLSYKQSKWQEANQSLGKALKLRLSNDERIDALYLHGMSFFQLKKHDKALIALEDVYPRLSKEKKKQALPKVITAAYHTKNARALVYWQTKQLPHLPESARKAQREKIIEAIDGSLSLTDLRVLHLKKGDKLEFPFARVALRLAKMHFHHQNYSAAEGLVRSLMGESGQDDELKSQIMDLHRRLKIYSQKPAVRTIGVILPKSGPGAGFGRWVRNAVELAKQKIPKVRVVYADSGSNPAKAIKAVDKLVFQDRVIAIFGPLLRTTSKAAAYRAQQLGVPLFSVSILEDLPKVGSYIFRNNLTLGRMGRAMARYAVRRLSLTKFSIYYPESSYGRTQVEAFWKEIARLGGRVVGAESYTPYTTNFEASAQKLVGRHFLQMRPLWHRLYRQVARSSSGIERRRLYKKLVKQFPPVTDFDAIFIPDSYRPVSMIAPTLAQQDIEVKLHYRYWEKQQEELYKKRNKHLKFIQLLGTNGWHNESLFRRAPRHVIGSIFCVRYFPGSKSTVSKNFIKMYQRAYPDQIGGGPVPRPPLHISAYAYDTMSILLHLAGGSNPPQSRKAFRDALLKIKDFPAVTGRITIQPGGEALAPITYLLAHRKQEFRLKFQSKWLFK